MEAYPKSGNSSAINGYEIYADRIYVRYQGGRVYGYSYDSAGAVHVEEMKRLAEAGEGLTRYIRKNVSKDFFFKEDESVPRPVPNVRKIEPAGTAEMPPALRGFDFRSLVEAYRSGDNCVRVIYSETVAEEDKVPGLKEFVAEEYRHIIRFMMEFFHSDNLPWEISIELSDLHMVDETGSLTDTQIVDRIQTLFKKTAAPDPPEIQKILDERKSMDDILGLYIPEPRHIRLFYRMFDTTKGPEYYLAQVRQTLAHELLHAKHHIDASEMFCDDTKEAVRVQEALADFFAYYYTQDPETCIWGPVITEKSEQAAADRLETWERTFGGSWPYAYALMFFPVNDSRERMTDIEDERVLGLCISKYNDVWGTSQYSMIEAYYVLMHCMKMI